MKPFSNNTQRYDYMLVVVAPERGQNHKSNLFLDQQGVFIHERVEIINKKESALRRFLCIADKYRLKIESKTQLPGISPGAFLARHQERSIELDVYETHSQTECPVAVTLAVGHVETTAHSE